VCLCVCVCVCVLAVFSLCAGWLVLGSHACKVLGPIHFSGSAGLLCGKGESRMCVSVRDNALSPVCRVCVCVFVSAVCLLCVCLPCVCVCVCNIWSCCSEAS
jgi:hypothetical protein